MTQSREYSWSLRHTPKGPLVPYIDAFVGLLSTQGYTPTSVHLYTRLVADFSGWLKQKNITKEQITLEHTERYLRYRASHRRPRTGDGAAFDGWCICFTKKVSLRWRWRLALPRRCNAY